MARGHESHHCEPRTPPFLRIYRRCRRPHAQPIWERVIDAGPYQAKTTVHSDVIPVTLSESKAVVFEASRESESQSLVPFWYDIAGE